MQTPLGTEEGPGSTLRRAGLPGCLPPCQHDLLQFAPTSRLPSSPSPLPPSTASFHQRISKHFSNSNNLLFLCIFLLRASPAAVCRIRSWTTEEEAMHLSPYSRAITLRGCTCCFLSRETLSPLSLTTSIESGIKRCLFTWKICFLFFLTIPVSPLGQPHTTKPFRRDFLKCGNSILNLPLVQITYLNCGSLT